MVASHVHLYVLDHLGLFRRGTSGVGHCHYGLVGNALGDDVQLLHIVRHCDIVVVVRAVEDRGHSTLAHAQVIQQRRHIAFVQT